MKVSFKPHVHLHRRRKDNNYSVIIRIGFKSKYAFFDTDYSVSRSDLKKNGEIKNVNILDKCNEIIKKYREIASNIPGISFLTVKEVKQYIENETSPKTALDYAAISLKYLEENESFPSIDIYKATHNHITKFYGNSIPINVITPNFLTEFQKYLSELMGSRGVNLYLSTVRRMYNLIMDEYEYKGYEFHYPFRKYKIPKAKYSKTVAKTREQLKVIMHVELKGLRANRARDIFVISLLTLGTNAKDLFLLDKITDRIEYNRSKTKEKRDDDAFISIKVESELLPYIEKYKGSVKAFKFFEWYSNNTKLNECLWKGLEQVVKQINAIKGDNFIDHLEYYDARRTIASVMRNKLGISKDDVAMCLNHVDNENKITDIYIEKDFSILDKSNRKFIDWLFEVEKAE